VSNVYEIDYIIRTHLTHIIKHIVYRILFVASAGARFTKTFGERIIVDLQLRDLNRQTHMIYVWTIAAWEKKTV